VPAVSASGPHRHREVRVPGSHQPCGAQADHEGHSALHWAVHHGHHAAAGLLLAKGDVCAQASSIPGNGYDERWSRFCLSGALLWLGAVLWRPC
jgi:ankyrin repeat protein